MLDVTSHPRLLRLLSLAALPRDYLVRRANPVRQSRANRDRFYDQTWRSAAEQLGADVQEVCSGVLAITRGEVRALVRANYTTLDDPVTLFVAGDKPVVHRRLGEYGLPTPRFREFTLASIAVAIEFLRQSQSPCVVKPASGTGAGQGITTGIRTRSQLAWAAATAARFGKRLLIEQQVPGDNYRLLYLDGVLLDAVKRLPPSVLGDGKASLRALIRRENAVRTAGWDRAQVVIHEDRELNETLASQGLCLHSVPGSGRRVVLKTVINDNAAQDNQPAGSLLCEDVVQDGARAARALGVRLAGVDVITSDPGHPLADTGGVILEVNTTPGLYHHKRGGSCPVATTLLEAMLQRAPAQFPSTLVKSGVPPRPKVGQASSLSTG